MELELLFRTHGWHSVSDSKGRHAMSYSINGFRVAPGTDPFAILHRARPVLEPIRARLVAAEIADLASSIVHTADLTGEAPERGPVHTAAKDLSAETEKGDWRGLKARLAMASDPKTGRVHLLMLGCAEYCEAVAAMDGLEDYSYWNGTDGPDDVSEEDWEERRRSWDRILPGMGHIGNNMAVWNLDADSMLTRLAGYPEKFEAIEAFLPSRDDRAVKLVRDRIYRVLDQAEPLDFMNRPSKVFRRIEEASQMAQTEPFTAVRELVSTLIAPSDWETYGRGATGSLLRTNMDRVDWMVARALNIAEWVSLP